MLQICQQSVRCEKIFLLEFLNSLHVLHLSEKCGRRIRLGGSVLALVVPASLGIVACGVDDFDEVGHDLYVLILNYSKS